MKSKYETYNKRQEMLRNKNKLLKGIITKAMKLMEEMEEDDHNYDLVYETLKNGLLPEVTNE